MPDSHDMVTQTALSAPAVIDETTAFMAMVERVISNPDIDLDRVERFMEMQRQITERKAVAAFTEAFAAMQAELPEITERGMNTNTKQKYALWEDINTAIRPVMAKHRFALNFRVDRKPDLVVVTAHLSHADGHHIDTTLELPVDTGPGRNAVQAVASSVSYGKRYTAGALLNLTSRGEDDDANATQDSAPYQEAMRRINMCENQDQLRKWKADHAEAVAKLVTAPENDRIVTLWNQRMRKLGERANG